ncbi:hypothetical protein CIHG_06470 [Coccidioides immitis H538.4]|uniref:Uncharacterized protein n=3 Tax=Coccidioides immitis TaxID=5501 RepID=A0A0J8QV35_COCIT|nr:hypothetical protein CIRG_10282 [Coccidioides immitis RMSCC 2394]KMU76729.1 hypothetical protein CISG_05872 [Coccidioides immitis RMSCC 3703]KMU88802.1 hypothetical protein CIHG_06470 [Coccidioides immitis H538.4]
MGSVRRRQCFMVGLSCFQQPQLPYSDSRNMFIHLHWEILLSNTGGQEINLIAKYSFTSMRMCFSQPLSWRCYGSFSYADA